MDNLDHHPIILTGRTRDHHLPISIKHHNFARFQDFSRTLQHVYAGAFFVMYVSLIGFIQVKFQNMKYSPFDTHVFFIIMSLVALPIAIVTSGVLFYTNNPLENINRKNLSSVYYKLLKVVFLFSTILAPLSLIPMLFIPSEHNWIGYSIICALFTIMVAYNFSGYIRLFEKKDVSNLAAHQMV